MSAFKMMHFFTKNCDFGVHVGFQNDAFSVVIAGALVIWLLSTSTLKRSTRPGHIRMMTEDKQFQRFAAENRDGTNVAEGALRAGHSGGSPQGQNAPPLCNFVDLEKCCKMTIYLQRSASIQPRTSLGKSDESWRWIRYDC